MESQQGKGTDDGQKESPAENAALATNTSNTLPPASSRKSVFTPQIAAAESV